jgi:hypothetical protein
MANSGGAAILGFERRALRADIRLDEGGPGMDATMHLIARSVQLAVMTAPSASLDDAVAAARRRRESILSAIRRAFVPAAGAARPITG